jgi:hypothetical protein
VKAAYTWALDTALRRHGIEMPFPQRELRVRSLFGLEGEKALTSLRGERRGSSPDQGQTPEANTSNDAVEEVLRPSEPSPQPDFIEPERPA